MTRAAILLCVLFLSCDNAPAMLTAFIEDAIAEPPAKHRIVCRDGAVAKPMAGDLSLTVHCAPTSSDGGLR
jgi:hypothetical protein